MADDLNLPPFLQEFDGFINVCKKMSADLAKANERIVEIETELAKEKAERRNFQSNSEKRRQELIAQIEIHKKEAHKRALTHQSEISQFRGMLMAAQNEHKSVMKIIQDELERTKQTLKEEIQGKAPLANGFAKLKDEHKKIWDSLKKEQEKVTALTSELEDLRNRHEAAKLHLKQAQDDYARVVEASGKTEQQLLARGRGTLRELEKTKAALKSESESKAWINKVLAKTQAEYDKLFKLFEKERETVKRLKLDLSSVSSHLQKAERQRAEAANKPHEPMGSDLDQVKRVEKEIRARDEEVIRIQEQMIKLKRNLKDTDEARKSAQALANQLRSDLESARSEIARLRSTHPLQALLENQEREIHDIGNQLSETPEDRPERAELIAMLETALRRKTAFEQMLSGA